MEYKLEVSAKLQTMSLMEGSNLIKTYIISTAKNGLGEQKDSEKTPRGLHEIKTKIGEGEVSGTVFVARRPTGEIYESGMLRKYPDRDWILTRIMWLNGLEKGKNAIGNVDTMQRYIYIHGCPDDSPVGVPYSRGCIRMRNTDIIELFDKIEVGTIVNIGE